jgi:hypothetical protein
MVACDLGDEGSPSSSISLLRNQKEMSIERHSPDR